MDDLHGSRPPGLRSYQALVIGVRAIHLTGLAEVGGSPWTPREAGVADP